MSNITIKTTDSTITMANLWDHFLARWGYKRNEHSIDPGIYAIGNPNPDSPVFVTANYTLSFDSLRSSIKGINAYILVLDTNGVNVWCAAGKETFGTNELVHRIEVTGLSNIVKHKSLILPQLGAPGVSAHQVKERTGFKVEYGPVRASDLPEYLKNHKSTKEMRTIYFPLLDRIVLIPVELVQGMFPAVILAIISLLIGGFMGLWSSIVAVLTGMVLFPILLPWIPTKYFSTKGFILGGIAALPFAISAFTHYQTTALWFQICASFIYLLAMPPITAFLALNFTGATTFTSRTAVKNEIFYYVPVMAIMFGTSILLIITLSAIKIFGGSL
ncbi:MAG: carbon monoxide dehydrogenase [Desulfobacterales bacterium]|nr:carbon monoxide dehydrogenase [Desulfobacterales bacterium]